MVTPTVEFLYDSLSRLVIARGGYFGHYAYDAIGNIAARDGGVYTYTNEQPHAVRQVIGSGAPITRTVTLMARAEGGDTTVTLEVNGSTRGAWNVISATQYATYTLEVALTGHDVFELWFDDGGGTRTLYVDRVEVQRVDLPPLTDPLSHRLYMAAILRNTEGEGDGGLGLGLGAPLVHVQGEGGPVAVIEAEGGAMLYGHGDAEEAFQPGHVTPGQEELTQSGALRFVVGERAYAAEYDGNGNMASRATEAGAQVLTWDAENRLVGYQSSVSSASYAYDGDGVRVRTVLTDSGGVTTTVHIGGTYEWVNGSAARSYYYQGSQRVALREGGELYFLLGDHLGSTSVSYRVSDGQTVTQTYHAWGDIRPGPDNELPTDYAFTGQRLQGETGLYQMGARWYDALTGRWLSADTIVPGAGNPQSLNRYTYVNNNPLRYTDPTGRFAVALFIPLLAPATILVIACNPALYVAAADLAMAVGQGLAVYGPAIPAYMDQVSQYAGEIKRRVGNTLRGGESSFGQPSGNIPDPFKDAPSEIRQGIETLRQQAASEANYAQFRYGAQANLSRAEYYYRQGLLKSVHPTGSGTVDLLLNNNTAVEVKYWSAEYLAGNAEALADQLLNYNDLGSLRQITVEFVQTSQNPVTSEMFGWLGEKLAGRGLDLSKFVFTVVSNPGIP